jgi:uncharacterized protein (TIGR03083 family)
MSASRGTVTPMENSRYMECLSSDYADLRDAAASAELTAPVPCCPGWTMADLVFHVGEVYLEKATSVRTGQSPQEWPPPGLAEEAPLALLARAYGELIVELSTRDPGSPTPTWYEPDQTVGFWIRRMAQETVIHRIDAEQAAGLPVTPVPDDLAIDGIDEVLRVFLSYASVNWPDEFSQMKGGHLAGEDGQETITITAGPDPLAAWTLRPSPRGVLVADGAGDGPRVALEAAPDPMLRWLWGRAGDDVLKVTGDPAWVAYLRRMMAEITQ